MENLTTSFSSKNNYILEDNKEHVQEKLGREKSEFT